MQVVLIILLVLLAIADMVLGVIQLRLIIKMAEDEGYLETPIKPPVRKRRSKWLG
jgi:hypothetical protein